MAVNKPNRVILHCSDTPDYPDASEKYDLFGAKDIDVWHKQRGWQGIGYHYVIRRTGILEKGRPNEEVGAHCEGQNQDSIGICYIGKGKPTEQQIDTLLKLYSELRKTYGIVFSSWHGHYEFNSGKECPGFSANILRRMLKYYDNWGGVT